MGTENNPNLPESVTSAKEVERKEAATPDDAQGEEQVVPVDLSEPNFAKAQSDASPWQRLNMRGKATLLAIAISTLPVLVTGAVSYYFTNRNITQRITEEQADQVADMADKVNRFVTERYVDIKNMASLSIFADPRLREVATAQEKDKTLKGFMDASGGLYNSIGIFEMNGNLIAQGETKLRLPNHKSRDYFQSVLKTDKPAIAQPRPSKTTGVFSLHFAAPVKDTVSGKTIAIIRSRSTVEDLENFISNYRRKGETDYVLLAQSKLSPSQAS